MHRAEEGSVPVVVQVAEAVAETERGVEVRRPRKVAHLASLEHGAQLTARDVAPGGLDRTFGEVDPREVVAPRGELGRQASRAAGDVEHARTVTELSEPLDERRFAPREFVGVDRAQRVERDAREEGGPPIGGRYRV